MEEILILNVEIKTVNAMGKSENVNRRCSTLKSRGVDIENTNLEIITGCCSSSIHILTNRSRAGGRGGD